jgi:protein-L-isoaspartate(D-aspartate) O-methyltransferase
MPHSEQTAAACRRLLAEIEAEAAETAPLTGRARFAPKVMAALAAVPRHCFVARRDQAAAYDNRPLGIGYGQTISQPFIVAIMTDLLDLQPEDRVLEIGTGCGYQTAVLAELAAFVYSLEAVRPLAEAAEQRLAALGYRNVAVRCGDGYRGWPEAAPFDAVIVTAAAPEIPPHLVEQLKAGGRMVLPVGAAGTTQSLYRCVKQPDGRLAVDNVLPVAFVPMVEMKGEGYQL